MLKLAEHILETKTAHFDPKTFKDEYVTALRKLVQKKAAGKKIEVEKPEEKPINVINLMDALRQSINSADRRRPRRKTRRGATRSRRAA